MDDRKNMRRPRSFDTVRLMRRSTVRLIPSVIVLVNIYACVCIDPREDWMFTLSTV